MLMFMELEDLMFFLNIKYFICSFLQLQVSEEFIRVKNNEIMFDDLKRVETLITTYLIDIHHHCLQHPAVLQHEHTHTQKVSEGQQPSFWVCLMEIFE